MKPLYTAEVSARGGRVGHVKSQEGNLNLQLSMPEKMGGDGAAGTNPEQLFAAAYGAAFLATLQQVAIGMKQELKEPRIIVKVSLHEGDEGYHLSAAVNVVEEALPEEVLEQLVKKAHETCPYSRLIRGNIEALLTANKMDVEA